MIERSNADRGYTSSTEAHHDQPYMLPYLKPKSATLKLLEWLIRRAPLEPDMTKYIEGRDRAGRQSEPLPAEKLPANSPIQGPVYDPDALISFDAFHYVPPADPSEPTGL